MSFPFNLAPDFFLRWNARNTILVCMFKMLEFFFSISIDNRPFRQQEKRFGNLYAAFYILLQMYIHESYYKIDIQKYVSVFIEI